MPKDGEEKKIIIVENLDIEQPEITKLGKSTKWKPYLNSKTVEFVDDDLSREHDLGHSDAKAMGLDKTDSRISDNRLQDFEQKIKYLIN